MKKLMLLSLLLYGTTVLAQTADTTSAVNVIGPLKTTAGDGMLPSNNIVQNVERSRDLTVFSNFIKSANLTETYESKGPITLFVPADEAFANLPVGALDSLLKPSHVWELTGIITYHAIAGKLKAKDIEKQVIKQKGTATFTTLGGAKLIARIDSNRNIILQDESGGQSVISRFDMEQNNGMIHIVNKVLIPKNKVI